tara:strand:+ start:1325 stop:1633 length:309 start_codon:yes stop_codon:yes gene_type:complete
MAKRSVVANPVPEKFTVTACSVSAAVEAVTLTFTTADAAEEAGIGAPGKLFIFPLSMTTEETACACPGTKRMPKGIPSDHIKTLKLKKIETDFCKNFFTDFL